MKAWTIELINKDVNECVRINDAVRDISFMITQDGHRMMKITKVVLWSFKAAISRREMKIPNGVVGG